MTHAATTAAIIAANAQQARQRAEQQTLDAFRVADATAPERALPLARITGVDADAHARLRDRGIVREARSGTFYLDERAVIAARGSDGRSEGRKAVIALVLGLGGLVLLLGVIFLLQV